MNEDPPKEPESFAHSPVVRKYALAIEAGDIDTVVRMSSGFLICADKSELGFTRAARTDLSDADGALATCLRKAAAAVVALGENVAGADDQLRFVDHGGIFCVTKFPASSPLKEVVFTWEVDDWRVFEVTLR